MHRPFSRFLLLFCSGFLASAVFAAAMVAAVDPLGWLGFNQVGLYFRTERPFKFGRVQLPPYDSILAGSSRTGLIDPELISPGRFFNASFSAALPEEIEAMLEQAPANIELIVLGLDFYMFNQKGYPQAEVDEFVEFSPAWLFARLKYLISTENLRRSFDVLIWHRQGIAPAFLLNGQTQTARDLLRHKGMAETDFTDAIRNIERKILRDFAYAEWRLDCLRRIRDRAAAQGIRLVVFIEPESQPILDTIGQVGLMPLFQKFKQDLKAIFPQIVDFTDSPYVDAACTWRFDPMHYRPQVGREIVLGAISGRAAASERPPAVCRQ